MELPRRYRPVPAEVVAVREVRMPVGARHEQAVRDFYERFFLLEPRTRDRDTFGGWLTGKRRRGIFFLYQHDPEIDPNRPRLRLLVQSLPELMARLEEAEWPYRHWHAAGLTGDWLHVTDPAGHVIEVRQSTGLW